MSRKSTDKLFDGVSSGGSRGGPPPYFGLKKIADGKKNWQSKRQTTTTLLTPLFAQGLDPPLLRISNG